MRRDVQIVLKTKTEAKLNVVKESESVFKLFEIEFQDVPNQDVFGESRSPAMYSPASLQGPTPGHKRDQKEADSGRNAGGGVRSNSGGSELEGRPAITVPHRLEKQEASQDEQQTASDLP